ncbi:MAG TPA: hypothetical protein VHL31_17710 [Geminicoccus sp.]|jgi:hypothetical protein|nr:hypothetical protein [Geminicoccus sp.]HEX2528123.1 hypothetical protein [Geminicoccus sp.]
MRAWDPLVSVLNIHRADDGSVFAGDNATGSVYRLYDRNGDGNANDAGEAKVWLDLQTINPNSSAFEISFSDNVACVTDTNGRDPDAIYRIVDKNRSGDIQAGEVSVFIADGNVHGVNPDFAHDAASGSVYAFEFTGGGNNRVWRLTDKDKSDSIDAVGESQEIWSAALLPEGHAALAGPGMDVQSDGSILLALNGSQTSEDSVVHLVDGNGHGDLQDEGETRIVLSHADGADYVSRPRPVEECDTPTGRNEPPLRGTEFSDRFLARRRRRPGRGAVVTTWHEAGVATTCWCSTSWMLALARTFSMAARAGTRWNCTCRARSRTRATSRPSSPGSRP